MCRGSTVTAVPCHSLNGANGGAGGMGGGGIGNRRSIGKGGGGGEGVDWRRLKRLEDCIGEVQQQNTKLIQLLEKGQATQFSRG